MRVTLATLRGQIGAANEGKVLAVAPIPNSPLVATGGFFAAPFSGEAYGDIRIFDRKSGRLASVLRGLELPVFDLAASSNGEFLAAVGQEGRLLVWQRDEEDWRLAVDLLRRNPARHPAD